MKHFFLKVLPYPIVFWIIVGFFGIIITDFLFMPIIAGHFKTQVTVPPVVGVLAAEAESVLTQNGLQFIWAEEGKYSATIPSGHVLVQIPSAGRTVKENRNVVLTVSKGKRELKVPALRGSSKRQAEIRLQRMGLTVGKFVKGGHSSIPRGVIIRSEPAAGELVRIGGAVDLIISSGNTSGKEKLPNLTGTSFVESQSILDSLGFAIGTVTKEKNEDNLPNTVLKHYPQGGEFLESGSVINIVISE